MTIPIKYLLIVILASAAIGAFTAKKLISPVEVVKTQIVDNVVTKDHVVTVVKEVDRPDGTKEITTTKDDNSVKVDDKNISIIDQKAPSQKQWFVTGGAGLDSLNLTNPIYQLSVNRRILGPFYAGAWVNNRVEAGIQLGFEF